MANRSGNAATRWNFSTAPLRALYGCACLLAAILVFANVSVLINLRDETLHSKASNHAHISLTLAEQANRAMQGLDLVLSSLLEQMRADGVVDSASYTQKMSGYATHLLLKEKLTGLSYLSAITMVDADGKLINFSRYWPIPAINIADRDYFKALQSDPGLSNFISVPVANRGDGTWTVYLARTVRGPEGNFAGLLLGAIDLKYFEDLYHSVWLGPDNAISLLRDDGVLLARYPPVEIIGSRFPDTHRPSDHSSEQNIILAASPVDGTMRIKAASGLRDYPMFVLVTQTVTAALADWTRVSWTIGLTTFGCIISIVVATAATAHGWRSQALISSEQTERAEAERARALSEAALAQEREKNAEEASRAKSAFLAMMSHEIRTPMNAVLGLAGSLLDEPLPERQRLTVEAIRDSGDSLLRILNDILDFSKLDAGRMTFEDMPFSPATLTHNTVSVLGPRATAKGLTINATSDPSLPATLLGDAGRIRQVLLNLVSNAVKFTDQGSITIDARCVGKDAATATIEWVVSDTGIGIAPDRIRSLFREFIQMDNSIHRRFGGSGLGLAICKRLTDQMGGTIEVTSTVGQGTSFQVRLTLPLCDQPVEEPPAAVDVNAQFEALRQSFGRPLRLLFAEDNPTNQYVAVQLLKAYDVQINVVGDGLEAVNAACSFPYDAICMDVRMPEMDGLAATRLIRRKGGPLARIPIIALTANAFPEDVQACFQAGMNHFVAKPVNKEALLGALITALSGQIRAPAPPGPSESQTADATPAALDEAALVQMTEEIGDDGVAEMVTMFERETLDRLARLAEPIDAPETVVRECHTLKGAARTVCAPHLAARAAAAEQRAKQTGTVTAEDLAELRRAFDAWSHDIHVRLPDLRQAA